MEGDVSTTLDGVSARYPDRNAGSHPLRAERLSPVRGTHRWGISMCLRPNRRASTEQPPGPSSASAAPKTPNWTNVHGSAGCDNARPSSATAISPPAIGVHNPISNRTAATAVTISVVTGAGEEAVSSPAWTSGMAVTARNSTRPAPGRPYGNVEKSLCTNGPAVKLSSSARARPPR